MSRRTHGSATEAQKSWEAIRTDRNAITFHPPADHARFHQGLGLLVAQLHHVKLPSVRGRKAAKTVTKTADDG